MRNPKAPSRVVCFMVLEPLPLPLPLPLVVVWVAPDDPFRPLVLGFELDTGMVSSSSLKEAAVLPVPVALLPWKFYMEIKRS